MKHITKLLVLVLMSALVFGVAQAQDNPYAANGYAIYMAEYITDASSGEAGNEVIFSDVGNRQLGADFVPGQSLDGTDNISYLVDNTRPSADVPFAVSDAAIDRAMATWNSATCANLGIFEAPSTGPTGFVAAIFGFGGSLDYFADVTHSGWLPPAFFDILAPDGGDFILGVAFTIIFTDEAGNPSDANGDGKTDVAWREIYYNDAFTWNDGATVDIETIALHEAGHGLSQAHFGRAFVRGNGQLQIAPSAVMNAGYFGGVQTSLTGTDNAGHCSNWANWPNN